MRVQGPTAGVEADLAPDLVEQVDREPLGVVGQAAGVELAAAAAAERASA